MEKKHEELQYLELIRDLIENGTKKEDRTGVGTIGKFGAMMRFSLRDVRCGPIHLKARIFLS